MPLYLDIHDLHGPANIDELAKAHAADLEVQEKYGVNYLKYWVNKGRGKVFCLVDAPNAEAANQVHKEAHGLVAEKIIERVFGHLVVERAKRGIAAFLVEHIIVESA